MSLFGALGCPSFCPFCIVGPWLFPAPPSCRPIGEKCLRSEVSQWVHHSEQERSHGASHPKSVYISRLCGFLINLNDLINTEALLWKPKATSQNNTILTLFLNLVFRICSLVEQCRPKHHQLEKIVLFTFPCWPEDYDCTSAAAAAFENFGVQYVLAYCRHAHFVVSLSRMHSSFIS